MGLDCCGTLRLRHCGLIASFRATSDLMGAFSRVSPHLTHSPTLPCSSDNTVFGSATDGFVLAPRHFAFNNMAGTTACVPLSDVQLFHCDTADFESSDLIIDVPLRSYRVQVVLADGNKRSLTSRMVGVSSWWVWSWLLLVLVRLWV